MSGAGASSGQGLEATQAFGAFDGFAGSSAGGQGSGASGASGTQSFGAFGGPSGAQPAAGQELPSGLQTFDTPSGPVFTGPQKTGADQGGAGGESAFGSSFGGPSGATQTGPQTGSQSGPQTGPQSGPQSTDSSSGSLFGAQQPARPGQQPGFSSPPPAIGRMRSRRFDFPDTDVASTGPMPSVHDSPMEQQGEEYLPIFAAVESAWFRRAPVNSSDENGESGGWRASSADAGWQAAAVVRDPVREGKTASGLPKRIPKANLVPGSVPASSDSGRQQQAASGPQRPLLSPDRARSRLSSFQQGIRQGRAVARGEMSEEDAYPSAFRTRFDDNKEDA